MRKWSCCSAENVEEWIIPLTENQHQQRRNTIYAAVAVRCGGTKENAVNLNSKDVKSKDVFQDVSNIQVTTMQARRSERRKAPTRIESTAPIISPNNAFDPSTESSTAVPAPSAAPNHSAPNTAPAVEIGNFIAGSDSSTAILLAKASLGSLKILSSRSRPEWKAVSSNRLKIEYLPANRIFDLLTSEPVSGCIAAAVEKSTIIYRASAMVPMSPKELFHFIHFDQRPPAHLMEAKNKQRKRKSGTVVGSIHNSGPSSLQHLLSSTSIKKLDSTSDVLFVNAIDRRGILSPRYLVNFRSWRHEPASGVYITGSISADGFYEVDLTKTPANICNPNKSLVKGWSGPCGWVIEPVAESEFEGSSNCCRLTYIIHTDPKVKWAPQAAITAGVSTTFTDFFEYLGY
jgi:hypothetical protein